MEHDYASNLSKSCVNMRFRDDTFLMQIMIL